MQSESTNRFTIDAKGEELFLLYLKNIFFTIITLGVYYFWAKVNTQKFLHRHLSFQGYRFDYHGTGKENFIGFLKAIGIILVGALTLGGIFFLASKLGVWAIAIVGISFYAGILCAIPYIIIGSRRYFLSRTSFNNIRFRFTGNIKDLIRIFIPNALLTAVTLGIYSAWFTNKLEKFFIEHSHLGNADFQYDGQGKELFFIYLKGIFFTIITAGIYSFWFQANVHNYFYNHTRFQNIRFRSDLQGGKIFTNTLISMGIILFTLGIGIPWAYLRFLKLITDSLSLESSPNLSSIQSVRDPYSNALADGLQEAGEAISSVFSG
ncbi:YjgN family protein [Leptospira sp. WS92.C1]